MPLCIFCFFFSNAVPFKLQEGEVRIIPLEQCQSYFDMKTITSRMICAGYEAGTVDSCMVSRLLTGPAVRILHDFGELVQLHYKSCVVPQEHLEKSFPARRRTVVSFRLL